MKAIQKIGPNLLVLNHVNYLVYVDISKYNIVTSIKTSTDTIHGLVKVSKDVIATYGDDNLIKLWHLLSKDNIMILRGYTNAVTGIIKYHAES